jgi:hypothetical protein
MWGFEWLGVKLVAAIPFGGWRRKWLEWHPRTIAIGRLNVCLVLLVMAVVYNLVVKAPLAVLTM